jgi:hypothetical protein
MGLITGLFTTGVLVVAAQMLPVGPEIGGYSRYPLLPPRDLALHIPGTGQDVDAVVYDAMESPSFSTAKLQTPLLDVDDLLVNSLGRLSTYALSGQPLASVHPDYLQELFGQRLGLEPAAKHSAPNFPATPAQVKVTGLYHLAWVEQRDAMDPALRQDSTAPAASILRPGENQLLLVVRTMFAPAAGDADQLVRFSTGSCRLVCRDPDGGNYKDYYPLGTLEAGTRLYANHLDDPLFVDMHHGVQGADLVFLIDNTAEITTTNPGEALEIHGGTLLEIKRMGFVDVSRDDNGNPALLGGPPPIDAAVKVMRQLNVKPLVAAPPVVKPKPAPTKAPTAR